jgi:hypothetical protein
MQIPETPRCRAPLRVAANGHFVLGVIAGSIAARLYGGVPSHIRTEVEARLPVSVQTIVADFVSAFPSAG